jgi:hypothetical protein
MLYHICATAALPGPGTRISSICFISAAWTGVLASSCVASTCDTPDIPSSLRVRSRVRSLLAILLTSSSARSFRLPRQFFFVESNEKQIYATQRGGTSALPLECVSTNHRYYSKRHRSALGKQPQPAEPEALSRNGSSGACKRDATTVNSH